MTNELHLKQVRDHIREWTKQDGDGVLRIGDAEPLPLVVNNGSQLVGLKHLAFPQVREIFHAFSHGGYVRREKAI